MRVAVLNVKFSPNLGDGLLAECLEAELRASTPGLKTLAIDLAGRTAYGVGGISYRQTALAVLSALPGPLRRAVVGTILSHVTLRSLVPGWRKILSSVDAVVVGGGNLISDNDLNFPIKLRAAMGEAADKGLPVALFGVGVADNWSSPGARMFRQAFGGVDLIHAAVRDTRSQAIWRDRLEPVGIREAAIVRDPAVLTALHFPAAPRSTDRPRIAVGLTNPVALSYHGSIGLASGTALTEWMLALICGMVSRGWQVSVFTNGSPEDRAYLERLAPRLRATGKQHLELIGAFETPADLARFISGQDLVLAHRLHACICGFAYAIPTIGFTWDRKLDSFFESVGRCEYIVDAGRTPVVDTLALADRALTEGADIAVRDLVVAESRTQVAMLAKALVAAYGSAA